MKNIELIPFKSKTIKSLDEFKNIIQNSIMFLYTDREHIHEMDGRKRPTFGWSRIAFFYGFNKDGKCNIDYVTPDPIFKQSNMDFLMNKLYIQPPYPKNDVTEAYKLFCFAQKRQFKMYIIDSRYDILTPEIRTLVQEKLDRVKIIDVEVNNILKNKSNIHFGYGMNRRKRGARPNYSSPSYFLTNHARYDGSRFTFSYKEKRYYYNNHTHRLESEKADSYFNAYGFLENTNYFNTTSDSSYIYKVTQKEKKEILIRYMEIDKIYREAIAIVNEEVNEIYNLLKINVVRAI
jgi:hypothetical protein